MKDGLRFVDCDMHIMEPPDLFDRYLDPKFKHRVTTLVGADGRPKRGAAGSIVIDGIRRGCWYERKVRESYSAAPRKTGTSACWSGSGTSHPVAQQRPGCFEIRRPASRMPRSSRPSTSSIFSMTG